MDMMEPEVPKGLEYVGVLGDTEDNDPRRVNALENREYARVIRVPGARGKAVPGAPVRLVRELGGPVEDMPVYVMNLDGELIGQLDSIDVEATALTFFGRIFVYMGQLLGPDDPGYEPIGYEAAPMLWIHYICPRTEHEPLSPDCH